MYPHERSLVKRLADKPFVLLGVNSDRDREKLKETLKEENITWRSFWNGGSTGGPISTEWNVRGWPTLYLIDANGVIRHKYLGSPGEAVLDEAIDTLVRDAEANPHRGVVTQQRQDRLLCRFRQHKGEVCRAADRVGFLQHPVVTRLVA